MSNIVSRVTFEDVMYDETLDDNEIGREILRRVGFTPRPGRLICPGCGAAVEDDDEETFYLPEGVFWHDECYTFEAMPVLYRIYQEEVDRRNREQGFE